MIPLAVVVYKFPRNACSRSIAWRLIFPPPSRARLCADDLHERSWATVQRLGEHLKHRAPLVLIDENAQLTKRLLLHVELPTRSSSVS